MGGAPAVADPGVSQTGGLCAPLHHLGKAGRQAVWDTADVGAAAGAEPGDRGDVAGVLGVGGDPTDIACGTNLSSKESVGSWTPWLAAGITRPKR